MNKEVEKMSELILEASEDFYQTKCCEECAVYEAIALYEAGYRKQNNEADKLEYVFVTNKRKNIYWVCGLDGGLEVWKETFSGRNALERAVARFKEMQGDDKNQ